MYHQPKKCLHCHKPLAGRSDKKYCDLGCKSAYSNQKKHEKERIVITINKQLRQNWKILKTINPQGKSTLRKAFLISQGYNFNYFTNVYRTESGNIYYFCYDVGLREISKTHICIVNWQDYMESYRIPIGNYE